MENMRCVRVLFDDFEKHFDSKARALNPTFSLHLNRLADGLVIEYYMPDDYEGKCPYILDGSDEELQSIAKEIIGFAPLSIVPFEEYVYCIAPAGEPEQS